MRVFVFVIVPGDSGEEQVHPVLVCGGLSYDGSLADRHPARKGQTTILFPLPRLSSRRHSSKCEAAFCKRDICTYVGKDSRVYVHFCTFIKSIFNLHVHVRVNIVAAMK